MNTVYIVTQVYLADGSSVGNHYFSTREKAERCKQDLEADIRLHGEEELWMVQEIQEETLDSYTLLHPNLIPAKELRSLISRAKKLNKPVKTKLVTDVVTVHYETQCDLYDYAYYVSKTTISKNCPKFVESHLTGRSFGCYPSCNAPINTMVGGYLGYFDDVLPQEMKDHYNLWYDFQKEVREEVFTKYPDSKNVIEKRIQLEGFKCPEDWFSEEED